MAKVREAGGEGIDEVEGEAKPRLSSTKTTRGTIFPAASTFLSKISYEVHGGGGVIRVVLWRRVEEKEVKGERKGEETANETSFSPSKRFSRACGEAVCRPRPIPRNHSRRRRREAPGVAR